MRSAVLEIGVLLVVLVLAAPADALTQRRINTLAACLLHAHIALVETPGIRRPAEPLSTYFERLLALQPGEKPALRRVRIDAYLTELGQTADRTVDFRKIPSLQTNTASNRALWQQISLNLSDVSAYLKKARREWETEKARPVAAETVKTVAQAIWHIQNAYAALRDALP